MKIIRWLKRFWERGTKGYCYEDLWEFDHFLSRFLVRALREFKANCHTYPNDIGDWETWQKTLDEMIECFDEQARNIDNLLGVDRIELWNKKLEERKAKIHRGFELLGKYYHDLWD